MNFNQKQDLILFTLMPLHPLFNRNSGMKRYFKNYFQ